MHDESEHMSHRPRTGGGHPAFADVTGSSGNVEARVDHDRADRCGFPEVVFAQGKTSEQVARIAEELLGRSDVLLVTRASHEQFLAVAEVAPDAVWHESPRLVIVDRRTDAPAEGHVVVASAGTADIPVAEEAARCAELMGSHVTRLFDVGVAGVHRALAHTDLLRSARVIVAVAGMEGALPSLVAGLVDVPVIAVPTSVGYGANLEGLSALLTMLNSCAGGIGVVNIDNGFGAAVLATRINRPGWAATGPVPTVSRDLPASATALAAPSAPEDAGATIAYLDCSTGVSGDKLLGALLDAGEQSGAFTAELLAGIVARIAPEARLTMERVRSHGIAAMGVRVTGAHEPHARHLSDIEKAIEAAGLPDAVRDGALATFALLADAESGVHGCSREEVHFHEVGAVDAIVDIVGVHAGLHALGIDRVIASPVAVGSGTVKCAHGTLPVPAPATARLLGGIPVYAGPATGELTTPTGAALVATVVSRFGGCPPIVPSATGHGAGTRDIGMPNICRIIVGASAPSALPLSDEPVTLLETNVDHISPEAVAHTVDRLLDEGVLDAWVTPITMKKGRPAMLLSALVRRTDASAFAERVIALTGTLGIRRTDMVRNVTGRDVIGIETPYGAVRVKSGAGILRPEADDVSRIARETSQPFGVVHDELVRLAEERISR